MSDYLNEVEQEFKAVKAQRDQLLEALESLYSITEPAPEKNCSCHFFPPCGDCVDYSALRDAMESAEEAIAKAKGGE